MNNTNLPIETYSGTLFDLANPNPDDVFIDEIAFSLAKVVRFNGHMDRMYSTAIHCCLLSDWVLKQSWGDKEKALLMLMHHGVDVYISDIPFAVKNAVPEIKPLKERVEQCVASRFNMEWPWPKWLLDGNFRLILQEQKQFTHLSDDYIDSQSDLEPLNLAIPDWSWQTAADEFLQRFNTLCPHPEQYYFGLTK